MYNLDFSKLETTFCCEGRTIYDSCYLPHGASVTQLFQNQCGRSSRWGDAVEQQFRYPTRFLAQELSIVIPEDTPQEFIDAVSVEVCVGETSYLKDPLKILTKEESHHGRCDSLRFSRRVGNGSSGAKLDIGSDNIAFGIYIPPIQNFKVVINVNSYDDSNYEPIQLFCELSGLFFRQIEKADISDD